MVPEQLAVLVHQFPGCSAHRLLGRAAEGVRDVPQKIRPNRNQQP